MTFSDFFSKFLNISFTYELHFKYKLLKNIIVNNINDLFLKFIKTFDKFNLVYELI